MIEPASKYQPARGPKTARGPVQTSGPNTGTPLPPAASRPLSGKTACVALPVFRRERIGGINVFIPRLTPVKIRWDEWMDRSLREGGFLERYMAAERHQSRKRIRAVAGQMHGWQQNMKSDYELKAALPAREFFRWKAEDPDFFRDDKNLKSLKRDNPDLPIFV